MPVLLINISACSPVPATPELTPVNVQLRWTHQSQFAGFYAAEENGDYAAEGLAVTFLEGGPDMDIHASVKDGRAQFGVAGADSLILRRAAGEPFKAIATIYRHNPLVFITLESSGITQPQDFAGKTILIASFNTAILHAMTSRAGVMPDQYTETCCDYGSFYSGEIDVAHAYLTNEVINARNEGHRLHIINPDDYGVHFYADTLYVTDEFATRNPDVVSRFLRATLRGWTYVVANPEAAGPLVQKYNPDADSELEIAKMTASIPLVNTGEDFIGWMKPGVWAGMETTLREEGLLTGNFDIEQVYAMQFIEEIYRR
ncbi:MAG TPA: ABC transporter substrate-binding protein [Anaerolineales bacterium]|nr:ABC transporter substrate-binding protein [Anaerolineales bacterium]